MAKTSGTPGKTQLINHFLINEHWYLVDLPGYGYAKVSRTQRSSFERFIADYLTKRETLYHIFVLLDARLDTQQTAKKLGQIQKRNAQSLGRIATGFHYISRVRIRKRTAAQLH